MKRWIVPVEAQTPIEVLETVDVFSGAHVVRLSQAEKLVLELPAMDAVFLAQAILDATAEAGMRKAKLAHRLADQETRRAARVKTKEARKIHDDDAEAAPPWKESK